jgi:hypothetical protein
LNGYEGAARCEFFRVICASFCALFSFFCAAFQDSIQKYPYFIFGLVVWKVMDFFSAVGKMAGRLVASRG